MDHKELKYSFNFVLNEAENISCLQLHHKSSHHHEAGEMCPAEYELHKHINIIREYMKREGI